MITTINEFKQTINESNLSNLLLILPDKSKYYEIKINGDILDIEFGYYIITNEIYHKKPFDNIQYPITLYNKIINNKKEKGYVESDITFDEK